ncbi:MAG: DUF1801 domain-containing protein [Anaerolineae bacterium]|nr:DUF1801 domain-containing protein [Anaerolineae bacterium]
MFPERYIEQYLLQIPPELRDIVLEIRNIVASVAPGATEKQHSRGFSYYHKERGGPVSAGICQIGIFGDHIRLAFIHGAFLDDPEGMLRGKEKAKRYMPIYSYEEAPWEYIRSLIEAHSRFAPYTYFKKNNETA